LISKEKKEVKKLWRTVFRPNCFMDSDKLLNECIPAYFKNSTPVDPCKYYIECLDKALRKRRKIARKNSLRRVKKSLGSNKK